MTPEAAAREKIDALLVAAGWAVQDYKAFNPSAARGIALREVPLESGRCAYLLLVDRVPLGVIEAKREGTTLSAVAQQSGHYGENLPDFLENLLPGTKAMPFPYESTDASKSSFVTSVIPIPARAAFSPFVSRPPSPLGSLNPTYSASVLPHAFSRDLRQSLPHRPFGIITGSNHSNPEQIAA